MQSQCNDSTNTTITISWRPKQTATRESYPVHAKGANVCESSVHDRPRLKRALFYFRGQLCGD